MARERRMRHDHSMMKRTLASGNSIRALSILAALACAAPASADRIAFDDGWQEQTFSLFGGGNDFVFRGDALDVGSDDAVSLVWTALPRSAWDAKQASWVWQVDASVPPTDLTRKGGDDRNLAVYFVFLPAADVAEVRDAGIRSLLNDPDARVLTYVWGGNHPAGAMLRSPYLGERGRTVALRPAGTGQGTAQVNLAADYSAAFGAAAPSVVGVAVSADSDHTGATIRARVSNLRLD
jgi:hypothetical protein